MAEERLQHDGPGHPRRSQDQRWPAARGCAAPGTARPAGRPSLWRGSWVADLPVVDGTGRPGTARAYARRSPRRPGKSSAAPRRSAGGGLVRRLDLPLQDLAGGALRQFVDDPYVPRVLVAGDLSLDVVAQLLGRNRCARDEGDGRGDLLAVLRMWHADHRRVAYRGMLVEHLFDLTWVDVVSAPDDQVLLPVDDVVVAVLVDPGHVPALEPAVWCHDLLGRVRPAPIALHHVVAADPDLPNLAGWQRVSFLVCDLHLDTLDRGADRPGLALPVHVVERGGRAGLGQPIALQDHAAEILLEATQHLHRQRRAA